MRYYSLVDCDGEDMGILKTTLSSDIVEMEWSMYTNNAETSNYDIEEFIELMCDAYPDHIFERFFIDILLTPSDKEFTNKSKINLNLLT